ncbi:hypothetical protein [Streptomyces alboflavus]|uniref:hypothetical protein n=1 Tax=Streptomyces alboflavus TaxID=67267 RepID=UPI0004C1AD58|nr:hypothetical protein [Streptomyces alboflavus]
MAEHEQTWDEGLLTEGDVIEAADGTGYTSVSQYVAGVDGHTPDDHAAYDTYDTYDQGHDDHGSADGYGGTAGLGATGDDLSDLADDDADFDSDHGSY